MNEIIQVVHGEQVKITCSANVTNVRGIEFDVNIPTDFFEIVEVNEIQNEQLDHYNGAVDAETGLIKIIASNSNGETVTGEIDVAEIIVAVKYVDAAETVDIQCSSVSFRDRNNTEFEGACIPGQIEILAEIVETSDFVLTFRIEKI